MRKIKRLCCTGAVLALLGASSTFAEQRPGKATVERVSRREASVTMTIRELEEWLRRRSRRVERRSDPPSRRAALVMPVAGVRLNELEDSFGDPRAGGRRHMGIDIFAPRWTEAVAATDGSLTAIGNGARSGRSLWLIGNDGRAFFYAHLEQWAKGAFDGMRVRAGQVIGYVGNSGNASGSPTHLHFEVRDPGGQAVNPYFVLAHAGSAVIPTVTEESGRWRTRPLRGSE